MRYYNKPTTIGTRIDKSKATEKYKELAPMSYYKKVDFVSYPPVYHPGEKICNLIGEKCKGLLKKIFE
ncbi:MAG TPA: hypothetical protein VJB35_06100 [Candidatus Nanoarchaeia archaeon]|nr:hypothetical protein [Candidatus Nanoarchaeia archaeon]